MKISYEKHRTPLYPRFCLLHSNERGGPVLKEESSWRTVNGFFIRTRERRIVVELWRHL